MGAAVFALTSLRRLLRGVSGLLELNLPCVKHFSLMSSTLHKSGKFQAFPGSEASTVPASGVPVPLGPALTGHSPILKETTGWEGEPSGKHA